MMVEEYEIILDAGRPFTYGKVKGKEELKATLKKAYLEEVKPLEEQGEDFLPDIFVYEGENDITESQLIEEMINEIMGEGD